MTHGIRNKELIIKLLVALFPSTTIYLFGSRARGTFQDSSDIDIAIDTGIEIPQLNIERAKKVLEGLYIPQKIDVVDFQSIPPDMQKAILKEGIIWRTPNG